MSAKEDIATILVVEDDAMINEDLVYLFQKAGFEVLRAYSLEEARGILRERHQDIRLMTIDNKMDADDDGAVLAREVKDQYPNIKTVMVSGTAPADITAIVDARFNKPYLRADLLATVRVLLATPVPA